MKENKRRIYILDITDKKENNAGKYRFTALAKCRKDPIELILSMGAEDLDLHILSFDKHTHLIRSFLWRINAIYVWWQLKRKLKEVRNSIIFMQYPFSSTGLHPHFILAPLNKNGNKTICLIHDIESIRLNLSKTKKNDDYILSHADCIILHSSAMIEKVKETISIKHCVPLEFFDYKSPLDLSVPSDLRKIQLIFAGNLTKSDFLKDINKVHFTDSFQLFLYGTYSDKIKCSENVIYKGKFDAEKFDTIEGNWGLVWDGDDVETCSGNFGEYQRLNAPFKLSLYLAAKRPVVVWAHAAMAEYVKKYKLGITVENLNEIPNVIASLTDTDIKQIKEGVIKASFDVRTCNKLKTAFEKCIEIME